MREWFYVAALAAAAGAMLAIGVWLAVPCKPGDGGVYIGGVVLLAGCPR
jgi:hypothetical protein